MIDRITPLVITYNEAPNIARTLDRLTWVIALNIIEYYRSKTPPNPTAFSGRRQCDLMEALNQEQPTEGVRPNARENGQIRPSTKRSGYPRCW